MFYLFYLLLLIITNYYLKCIDNGSTFDEWEGVPFDRKSSCEKYCLPKYIADGVCDMVCMTDECNNDGIDCECKILLKLLPILIKVLISLLNTLL